MSEKNKVVYDDKCIGAINDILNNAVGDIKVTCNVSTKDNNVVEENFMLDHGAAVILKQYYKSKQR